MCSFSRDLGISVVRLLPVTLGIVLSRVGGGGESWTVLFL